MTEQSLLVSALSDADKQTLSDLVYAITEGRADVPDLIHAMAPIMSGELPLQHNQAMALSIALNDIEYKAQQEDQLYSVVNNQALPSILLTEAGTLLAVNESASQQLNVINGDSFTKLGLTSQEFEALKQRLLSSDSTTLVHVGKETVAVNSQQPILMIARYHHSLQLIVLSALEHRWSEAIDQAMADLFSLTPSEREILSQMASGLTAEQIAENRARSVGTIRQQIKAILSKVGAGNQVQAATMAAAAAQALQNNPVQRGIKTKQTHDLLQAGHFYSQGRRIGWREYGDPKGSPVIYFHGPFFGMGCYQHERHMASLLGLRIIGIERAGFGRTELPGNLKEMVDTHVADTLTLMAEKNIESAVFYSQDNGIIPSVRMAALHPQKVSAIIGVSAPPLYHSLAQTNAMPSKQRLFVWAAQHAPWMVRLLIRVGMVQMRKLGPERWMEAAFAEVPNEMLVVNEPDNHEGNMASYAFNIQQNGRGLELDLMMTVVDWRPWLEKVNCPVQLLHGEQNQTSERQFVEYTALVNPKVQLLWQANAGQTLQLSHTEWVFTQLKQLAAA